MAKRKTSLSPIKKVDVPIKSRTRLPSYTDEQLEWLAKRVGLTLEQLKHIHRLAHATYQDIGGDAVEANDGKSLTREAVVEMVLDASYMHHTHLWKDTSEEIKQWLDRKSMTYEYDWVLAAVAAGFPYALYE